MTQMATCRRCGGAKFFGAGNIGWGGPLCNCQFSDIPNPDVPERLIWGAIIPKPDREHDRQVIELLQRIVASLDVLVERGNT